MQKFLVFAGTTEGRQALELLARSGCELWASAATEYGGESLPELPGLHILTGRMDECAIAALLAAERFACVLDATHPFATAATENIHAACGSTGTRYLRVLRAQGHETEQAESLIRVESAEAAARYLAEHTAGNVLLTTGSKELAAFAAVPGFAQRLFPRVLPVSDSLEKCAALGFPAKNIICMQGPFTAELNAAMLRQIGARWLVTKETGAAGGFPEKCEGARLAGVGLLVIGRPREEDGIPVSQLADYLEREFSQEDAQGSEPRPVLIQPTLQADTTLRAPYFPLFISLAGENAVVLGGGPIAARRVKTLLEFGCRVRVIAPTLCPELADAAQGGKIEAVFRKYEPGDCAGAALAVAATSERAANAAAAQECAKRGIPVSVADCKEESTFYFPGIVRRGSVVVGITVSGENHSLAKAVTQRIREEAPRLLGKNGEENK